MQTPDAEERELREIWKHVHDDYRVYRQSGLGISATTIALFVLLFQCGHGMLRLPELREFLAVAWVAIVAFGITAALLVQVFHYCGYKAFAERWFSPYRDDAAWQKRKKDESDHQFVWAHRMVLTSLGLLPVGVILSVILYCSER